MANGPATIPPMDCHVFNYDDLGFWWPEELLFRVTAGEGLQVLDATDIAAGAVKALGWDKVRDDRVSPIDN